MNSLIKGLQSTSITSAGRRYMCTSTVAYPLVKSTKEFQVKSFSFSLGGDNNHVTFQTPKYDSKTSSIIVGHSVKVQKFEAPILLRPQYTHTLSDKTVEEIRSLRPTMSQKQLAEKFQTSKLVISRVCRAPKEQLQKRIDTFQVKKERVVETPEVKKQRYDAWVEKMKQREFDLKVIQKAKGHEDQVYFRAAKHELAYMASQDTYDAMVSGYQLVRPDQLEDKQDKKKKPAIKQEGRRRRHVSEKEKLKNKAKSAKMRLLGRMEDA